VAVFIDRDVVANGDRVLLGQSGATPIQFSLDGPAEIVNVSVFNADGVEVRSIAVGAQPGGLQDIQWDGLDDSGNTMPEGDYSFAVTAQDEAGSTVATRTQVRGRVTGALYRDGTAFLNVGDHLVALTDVISVTRPATVNPSKTPAGTTGP